MKSLFQIFAFTFLLWFWINPAASIAQSGQWTWAKGAGGFNWEAGLDIATDASGNSYVTGYFQSSSVNFGGISLSTAGYDDVFLVKYNSDGNVVWAKRMGGELSDIGQAVTTDIDGNVYVTGFFRSATIQFGNTTLTRDGDYNIFLTKYDADGNVLWAKSAIDTSPVLAANNSLGISTDPSGNVYITGYFQSATIKFGTITLNSSSAENVFLVKYDGAGKVVWAKKTGGRGVAADSDGNLFTIGFTDSSEPSSEPTAVTLIKQDTSGNVQWTTTLESDGEVDLNDLATDESGNVFITGQFWSVSVTFDNNILYNTRVGGGLPDIFLIKYNTSGNLLWANQSKGNNKEESNGVATDHDGNVCITGVFETTVTFDGVSLTAPDSHEEVLFVEYDGFGNLVSANSSSGNNERAAYGYKIATDPDGNAVTTGTFSYTSISFGSQTLTNANLSVPFSYDMFIAKFGAASCTSPTNLTVTNITYNSAIVSWNNSNADYYKAAYKSNGTSKWKTVKDPSTGTKLYNTSAVISGLSSSTTYKWKVSSSCDGVLTPFAGVKGPAFTTLNQRMSEQNTEVISNLQLYPNPATGKFMIKLQIAGNAITSANVQVMNLLGQVILSQRGAISDGMLQDEVKLENEIADGNYLVRVIAGDEVFTSQITIDNK